MNFKKISILLSFGAIFSSTVYGMDEEETHMAILVHINAANRLAAIIASKNQRPNYQRFEQQEERQDDDQTQFQNQRNNPEIDQVSPEVQANQDNPMVNYGEENYGEELYKVPLNLDDELYQ